MLFAMYFASLVFWVFIVCGLIYFIRDAYMREHTTKYVPRTKWREEFYTPSPDPFLLGDK